MRKRKRRRRRRENKKHTQKWMRSIARNECDQLVMHVFLYLNELFLYFRSVWPPGNIHPLTLCVPLFFLLFFFLLFFLSLAYKTETEREECVRALTYIPAFNDHVIYYVVIWISKEKRTGKKCCRSFYLRAFKCNVGYTLNNVPDHAFSYVRQFGQQICVSMAAAAAPLNPE